MTTAAVLKLLATLATAMGGIYGTLYDFKKDGEITKHGRRAVMLIVCSVALAIGIQINDAADAQRAAEKLKNENDRLEAILRNSERTANGLTGATKDLTRIKSAVDDSSRSLKDGLDQQRRETQVVNRSLRQTSKNLSDEIRGTTSQLYDAVGQVNEQLGASVNQVDKSVRTLDSSSSRALARLSRPLREISFSFTWIYDDAAKSFGPYFERMRAIWSGQTIPFDFLDVRRSSASPNRLVLSEYSKHFPRPDETAFYLAHDSTYIGFAFEGEELTRREYLAQAWRAESEFLVKNDLERGGLIKVPNGPRIDLQLDFDGEGRVVKTISFAAVSLERNDGSITSEVDITEPNAERPLLLEIRHATGPRGGRLSAMNIHFHDNFYDSIDVNVATCARLDGSGDYWRCLLKPASR